MLKKYNEFTQNKQVFESAPSIPNDEKYWKDKGKDGKKAFIYTHDDLDGIFAAVVMKNYLIKKGFEIVGYGIVNYTTGWNNVKFNDKYINIALDFAEDNEHISIYMDHHGNFEEGENRNKASVKTQTGSAYEGICLQLGIPVDYNIVSVIDMVDSAKYDEYKVDITKILTFNLKDFKNKLEFAASFNQLLKRSEHKTFIEVIDNCKDMAPSVYNIYRLFKLLYPANNLNFYKMKEYAKEMNMLDAEGNPDVNSLIDMIKVNPDDFKHFQKDFIEDANWRLNKMTKMTRGTGAKPYIKDQQDFIKRFMKDDKIIMNGYQILGQMVYIPAGTWANALRGRAILEEDLKSIKVPVIRYEILKSSPIYSELENKVNQNLQVLADIKDETLNIIQDVTDSDTEGIKGHVAFENGKLWYYAKQPLFWLMLQYGSTLQMTSIHNMDNYAEQYLPKTKSGKPINDLKDYCNQLLIDFIYYFGYKVDLSKKSETLAGGHKGIGSISNIIGECKEATEDELKDEGIKSSDIDMVMKIRKKYNGIKFIDLIKNKVIDDLSGIPFKNLGMKWNDEEKDKKEYTPKEEDPNKHIMMKKDIRQVK